MPKEETCPCCMNNIHSKTTKAKPEFKEEHITIINIKEQE